MTDEPHDHVLVLDFAALLWRCQISKCGFIITEEDLFMRTETEADSWVTMS